MTGEGRIASVRSNSLVVWAGAAIVAIAGFMALSAAFGKPGDGNDPFVAELGNIGGIVAFAALLVIGIVALVRTVRGAGG